jgi:hypothetical protein
MSSGRHETIPTVSEVVGRAASIVDPGGLETAVTALFEGFEDDDRPATAPQHLAGELLGTVRAIDPDGEDPAAMVAVATATWLARHPWQADSGERAVREGVRLLFSADPPEPVADWLALRGFAV